MNKYKKYIIDLINKDYFVFIWLSGLTILCYGLLIHTLGFYWDDLPYLFQYSAFGPQGFPSYVASDRPFSAWIFTATTALFGYNPIGYHLLAIILRWLCASLLFLIMQEVWQDNKLANIIAASVMVVYPGFLQQPIALIYNHHFSVLAMFLASLLLMAKNIKRQKHDVFLIITSVVLTFSMFSIENFATLELIRPFILWKLLKDKTKSPIERFFKTISHWLPYFVIFIFFIIWRVVIFKFPTYQPTGINEILNAPLNVIGAILNRIPQDFFTIFLNAWWSNLEIPIVRDFGRTATYLFWVVTGLTILSSTVFLSAITHKQSNSQGDGDDRNYALEMLIASLLLFLFAGSIVWGLDLPVEILFAWDRMTLAFIPSVALLSGFIFLVFKKWKSIQIFFMVALITLSVAKNFQNSVSFKRDWENLNDLLSQLSWRIPALANNTIFITSEPGVKYYSDNSLTGPINLQYSDNISDQKLSHFVYFTNARTEDWFENNEYDQEYKKNYRSFTYYGQTSDAISFQFDPPGCVKIIDRVFYNSITTPNMTDRQVKEMRFTNLNLIQLEPEKTPFVPLFSESSTDSWCYFFEKADLARQFGDYEEIVKLAKRAEDIAATPRIANEWLPFLEGYLWTGNFEKAEMILQSIRNAEGNYDSGMCYTLRKIKHNNNYPYKEELEELFVNQGCK